MPRLLWINHGRRRRAPPDVLSGCYTYASLDNVEHLDLECPMNAVDDDHEKQWQLREVCTPLIHAVKHDKNHWERIDIHFLTLLPAARSHRPSCLTAVHAADNQSQHGVAQHLLSRFSRVPQRLSPLSLDNLRPLQKSATKWDGIKEGRWASRDIVPEVRSRTRLDPSCNTKTLLHLVADVQDLA